VWLTGRFENIDADYMENFVNGKLNELKRLKKADVIKENSNTQGRMVDFLIGSLSLFQEHLPVVKTLRTNGIAGKHWTLIGEILGRQLN